MVNRLTDPQACRTITDKHPRYFTFPVEDWLSDERNWALIENDNVAFADYKSPGVYFVHFCLNSARGRHAINLTKEMLDRFFQETGYKLVIGNIVEDNRKARWLIRQVGFKSLGMEETKNGPCEVFYHLGAWHVV